MAVGTKPSIKTISAKRAKSTTVAASKMSVSVKPAPRPKATQAAAKPVRRMVPSAAKATTTAAKKTITRPVAKTTPAIKKTPSAKKDAHGPTSFFAKNKKSGKPAKVKKAKLVRDSFTMPEFEYALITALKKRCLNAGVSAKKSEILRVAVINLSKLSDNSVLAAVRRLEVIKTGRPAKGSK